MNSENFFKKLRNVIREEIEYALDKKMTKPIVSKTSQAKEIQHGIKLYAEQTQKPVTNKTISKNSPAHKSGHARRLQRLDPCFL